MMRKMLLSFKPSVYKNIYAGVKIFEHRRNFPNEPIMAYMYVSKPVRAITGIVYLNNRHELNDWEQEFCRDSEALKRISDYKNLYRYAMEIAEFQETNSISLDDLKRDFPRFVAPQSYFYLDNNPDLLKYIEDRILVRGINIKHDFSVITSDQVCVH